MRFFPILLLATTALAQQIQLSHTSESLRGASAVSREIAWASGTHGTYLRTTDAGLTWTRAQVPDATTLDFRAVIAFSAEEAFLMSAGPADQSRIYHTSDAGQHWQLQFTNTNPKGFFDSMVFWDPKHGVVLGDPIPDANGKIKFELLQTEDGQHWIPIPPEKLPEAIEGEGAFAASNTCLAIVHAQPSLITSASQSSVIASPSSLSVIPNSSPKFVILSEDFAPAQPGQDRGRRTCCSSLSPPATQGVLSSNLSFHDGSTEPAMELSAEIPWKSGASAPRPPSEKEGASAPDSNLWFATGGKVARVFHSPDRGQTWTVANTPMIHGPESAGIFSIAFRDPLHGVIAGGDYKHPDQDGPNLAFTADGGKTWTLSPIHPQAYFSAAAYDQKINAEAIQQETASDASQPNLKEKSLKEELKNHAKPIAPERIFLVGHDFIFDLRPPNDPRRISPKKKSGIEFNAVSPYPEGGALIVGPKGSIASIP